MNQPGQLAPAPYLGGLLGRQEIGFGSLRLPTGQLPSALPGGRGSAGLALGQAQRPDLEPSTSHTSLLSPELPPNDPKNMTLCSKEPVSSGQGTRSGLGHAEASRPGRARAEKGWGTAPSLGRGAWEH